MSIKHVVKRDGSIVAFDRQRIERAVYAAARAVGNGEGHPWAETISWAVTALLEERFGGNGHPPHVEEIQDIVEEVLVKSGKPRIAKAYILYRQRRAEARETEQMLLDTAQLVDDYLQRADWRVNENSNMNYSLQGLNFYLASSIAARYWLQKIYPPEVQTAHVEADLHVHDLGMLSVYCCGWDLQDLLQQGFVGVPAKIESKPPRHLRTALGQLVNFFYTLQGESAGAVAVSNFDTLMAPFIHYDGLNYKQIKQAVQEFVYNINVPTRVGFQTPFTNLTMDLTPPPTLAEQPVIIGGRTRDATYGEFQREMDLLNRAFAEIMVDGDAKGRVFTFPIPTYNITADFDWDNPQLAPVWQMTAKYGIPYFANFVNSDMQPEDARSMCPIAAEEKVLIRSTRGHGLEYAEIRGIYEGNSQQETYEIYSHGKFIRGRFNKFEDQDMLKVTLANGHEIKMSTEHLNYVMRGPNSPVEELKGEDLKTEMYLPYSLRVYPGEGGNRDLGFFVGAYAGDGSLDGDTTVIFSLNQESDDLVKELKRIAREYFGAKCSITTYKTTKLLTLRVHSRAAVGLCRDFVAGKKRNKRYKAKVFDTSVEFRWGVIAGHYATDGGNRHRIYTSSPKMVESLNMLAATLGTTTSVYRDERPARLGKEPNYAVLVYQLNREKYGDFWYKTTDKLWMKIISIEPISNSVAYCFEVADGEEPMFTVGTTGILTHNCRLRLDNRELRKRMGGLFAAAPLTGSVGVVTMNLPRLGYLSADESEFRARLERLMEIGRTSLEIKRKLLEDFTARGLYPYSRHFLRSIKARTGQYWSNHFSTIGLNGMHEASLNLLGVGIETPEGRAFAERTLDFMLEVLARFQEETGNLYNLEATPAEGATYRLARTDKQRYPDIITAGTETAPYYTNSTHLPVDFSDDLFAVLDHQDPLQTRYTGGTVLHTYLGERLDDWRQARRLVRTIAEHYHLPYFTLTPTFSVCPVHGYIPGEHEFCPYEHTEEELARFGISVSPS
ncbi:MAG: ribonucleoside triphosphate reductase [Anaerolineae bacterium]